MKNPHLCLSVLFSISLVWSLQAQDFPVSIEAEYDRLTAKWLEVSDGLKTYEGLSEFCTNNNYRANIIAVLEHLHHYDSLVLDLLQDPTVNTGISHHEYKRSLADIQKLEGDFDMKTFISFLKTSCITRRDLERDKEDLKKESGMYSYDGQLLMLETQLGKFLKHIDKKVVLVDEHVHRIHPDQIRPLQLLSDN
ncbi:MAG: hypothetical protein RIC30_10215 [Marinoscillum sp.]|uniref:hypothetical protein n=1 Tax=Marinoscillum sp. TaxID=2024838 RepID=UPI0032F81B91